MFLVQFALNTVHIWKFTLSKPWFGECDFSYLRGNYSTHIFYITYREELRAAEDLSDPEECDKYWKYWNIRDQEQSLFGSHISIQTPAWLRALEPDCNHSGPVSTQQSWTKIFMMISLLNIFHCPNISADQQQPPCGWKGSLCLILKKSHWSEEWCLLD